MNLEETHQFLIDLLKAHQPYLKINIEKPNQFEVKGTKEAMQGKQKVDGFYFATVVPKPKDIRLYFFPIYTHSVHFESQLSNALRKYLKGQSCFHIKPLNPDIASEVKNMIQLGVDLYKSEGLI
ncbi:MAG: hypothetical protein ACJAZV_001966 [Roseivirga sp.]|jgi:hypothetical protein